ncbi:MAG: DUF922 domain-containing protein [Chitinophagaceae bacterium]
MAISGFDYKLSWDKDFPEENKYETRPAGKEYDSETHPKWKLKMYYPKPNGRRVIVRDADISVSLDKKYNWVVKSKMVAELLQHEQGHYDITAILARAFYVALKKLYAPSVDELKEKVRNLEQEFQKAWDHVQENRYDGQTKHGANKSLQKTWNQKISAEKKKPDGSIDNLP